MESDTATSSHGDASNVTKLSEVDLGPHLSVVEKVGYGLGDTASNILYQAWSFFLMIFYTDVFGIDAKVASFMFLITRVWDMVNDPVMGMIADRTNTRWGKFRPYLLWMAVPYGILACAMFITPDWGQNMKVVYAYVTYILATMAYTAINIPYSSLMAVMTPDPKERTTLSQYRFFFAFVGAMLITTFTLPLAKFFGNNPNHPGYDPDLGYSQALGYQVTMGVFGAVAIILLLITFLTTRERVKPAKNEKSAFGADLKDVIRNAPWIVLFLGCIFWVTHNVIHNGAGVYFFDYVYSKGSSIMFTLRVGALVLDFDQTTVFLTVGTLGMMAGVFASTPLKKRFGKKPLIIFLSLASVVLGTVFYILPQHNFSTQNVISTEAEQAQTVSAADLDGDGDLDALSASAGNGTIAWYPNTDGAFSARNVITTEADGAMSACPADIDGDEDMDVLAASADDNTIAWYENDGAGGFANMRTISSEAAGATSACAIDLDGDGDLDVLAASAGNDTIAWFANDGSGGFSEPRIIDAAAEGATAVYAADLDGDGNSDALSATPGGAITWYRNDGAGNFVDPNVITTNAVGARFVYATDLDADKDIDVVSISATDGVVAWYQNNPDDREDGQGIFAEPRTIATGTSGGLLSNQRLATTRADGARPLFAADLDGDDDLDVLSASAADGAIGWYENAGASNFVLLLIANFLWSVVAGAMPVFLFAMFSDAADFHEWKFGRRATGLVIAGIMFAIKMGVAAGGFLNLQALGAFGYVAKAPQTPEAVNGIRLLFSMIPAGFILACAVLLCFYPINEKLLVTIEADLKQRKSDEQK